MRKLFLTGLLTFFFMFSSLALVCADVSPAPPPLTLTSELTNWLLQMGSWVLFLIVIGGAFIFGSFIIIKPVLGVSIARWIAWIGLLIVFLGIFGTQIVYIVPYLGQPVVKYAACTEIYKTPEVPASDLPGYIINVVTIFSCIFTGYLPTSLAWLGVSTFLIFGIIAPLLIIGYLFYEFTDFLSENARKVISVALTAMAFRFLLASLFLELLGYGAAGIGILLVDWLLFMILFRLMSGIWAGALAIEHVTGAVDRVVVAELVSRKEKLNEILNSLPNTDPMQKAYQKDLAVVEERLKKFEQKGVKTS